MDEITFNVTFNKITFKLTYNKRKFNIDKLNIDIKHKLKLNNNDKLFIICENKLFTQNFFTLNYDKKYYDIDVNIKKNGGLAIAMFGILIFPIIFIGKGFIRIGEIIITMFDLFYAMMKIFLLIFSPTELIDDIMFGVTFGINEMMKGISATISNGVSDPEDESAEQGPFALQSDDGGKTCMNPTYSTLFLLILCPPLAIIYKLGFLRGFVSAIICGVLCVKLFYFPGLLFAILHVLC